MDELVDGLVAWVVGGLVDDLVDGLVAWVVDGLVDELVGRLLVWWISEGGGAKITRNDWWTLV